jgi:class 3 adenylate cyclase
VNVIELGFQMIEVIREVREEVNVPGLDMRIGIHTGQVTAGIIGSNIVRYDIFGSDVLIANKMESNGEQGRVVISEDTKKILINQKKKFKFEKHVTVKANSINREIRSYKVSQKEAQDILDDSENEDYNLLDDDSLMSP